MKEFTHIAINSKAFLMDDSFTTNCDEAARQSKIAETALDLLTILERILYAHDNYGNGASMGEARLCNHYADLARAAIARAKGE